MKTPLRSLLSASVFFLLCWSVVSFTSCTPEESPDVESPSVSITSPGSDPFIKGTVNIQAEVLDNRAVKTVKIIIDGVEFKTLTSAQVNEPWDSKLVEDGTHTIEIVAEDAGGNQQSQTIEVNVLNYFVKFQTGSTVVFDGGDMWYYITKEDGTLVDVEKIANDALIKFETPEDFDESNRYVLTMFEYNTANGNSNFVTYPKFKAGTYQRLGYQGLESVNADIVINKDNSGTFPIAHAGGKDVLDAYPGSPDNVDQLKINVALAKDDADVFVIAQPELYMPPGYKVVEDMDMNTSAELNFSDFTPFDTHIVSLSQQVYNNLTTVNAAYEPGGDENFFVSLYMSNSDPGNITFYVPGTMFEEYFFNASFSDANGSHSYFTRGATAPTEIKVLDAELTSFEMENSALMVVTTGPNDYKYTQGNYMEESGRYHFWSLYLPEGNTSNVKLVVPEVLATTYDLPTPEDFNFTWLEVVDLVGISGVQEYLEPIFDPTAPSVGERLQESTTSGFYGLSTNGRATPKSLTLDDLKKIHGRVLKGR